jgi:hypothetical protein
MAVERCPNDGMSRGWHLFVNDTDGEGRLRTNGQLINCNFGEVEEKLDERAKENTSRQ